MDRIELGKRGTTLWWTSRRSGGRGSEGARQLGWLFCCRGRMFFILLRFCGRGIGNCKEESGLFG